MRPRLVICVLAGALVGCKDAARDALPEEARAGRSAAAAAIVPAVTGFPTAEALRDHLCSMSTAEDLIAMLDLIYHEQRVELATINWHRGMLRARLDYARALNDRFATKGGSVAPEDLGVTDLVAAMCAAEMERVSPVHARVRYGRPDGGNGVLVLERRGTWHVHVSTLNDGEDVTDVWFFNRQLGYGAVVQYHRDVAGEIREGRFDSVGQAERRLAELLAGPPPRLGTVAP